MIAVGSSQAVRLIGGNDGSLSENIGVFLTREAGLPFRGLLISLTWRT